MANDTFLLNLYKKLNSISKYDFDKFINNASIQYYNLDKSLENLETLINNSKWNDDVRKNLDVSFENMKALKDKCKNYNDNVIVPLSSEFELLQTKLKEYFNYSNETDDLTYIDSLFEYLNNHIDMIFEYPRSIETLIDNFYTNNSNDIDITYLDMIEDNLKSNIESRNKYKYYDSASGSYKKVEIDKGTKLNTVESIKENIKNKIKEDKKNNVSNAGNESLREECYKSYNKINNLLKYGIDTDSYNNNKEYKTVSRSINNEEFNENKVETPVEKKVNYKVETVTDVMGASSFAAAGATSAVSELVDVLSSSSYNDARGMNSDLEEEKEEEETKDINGGTAIHFINVTESDAILIESNKRFGLIDASSSEQVSNVMSYLRNNDVKHLDFIIASHHHWDHVSGLPTVINSDLVDNTTTLIYKRGIYDDSTHGEIAFNVAKDARYVDIATGVDPLAFYNQMVNAMNSKGGIMLETTSHSLDKMAKLGATYVDVGDVWKSYITFQFEKLNFKIYNLPIYTFNDKGKKLYSDNSNSLVTLITTASGQRILSCGDLDLRDDNETYYANLFGKLDVVKANHHGYTYSNSFSYLSIVRPTYMIVPNSIEKAKDHFHAPYLFLKKNGTKVYFAYDSAINGAVKVCCDSVITVLGNEVPFPLKEGWVPWSNHSKNPVALWKKWLYIENNNFLTGWHELTWGNVTGWYYFDANGLNLTGWHQLDWNGKVDWYFFGDEPDNNYQGVMYSNKWIEAQGKWYRLGNDGAMLTSTWVDDNGKKYYVDSEGAMLSNTKETIDNETYQFDANGVATKI